MEIAQLHSMSSCGTHLIQDLYSAVGVIRLHDPVFMLQAMYLSRSSFSEPCRMLSFENQTVEQTLLNLAEKIGIKLPANFSEDTACYEYFKKSLDALGHERFMISHIYALSHSRTLNRADGTKIVWSKDDRDNLQAFLEGAIEYCGIKYRQIAVVRNPVDNFLSQVERKAGKSYCEREAVNEINEFYLLVAEKQKQLKIPVIKYDDLCKANFTEKKKILAKLTFTQAEIDKLNMSMIHGGSYEKWKLYPPKQVLRLKESLKEPMELFGYEVHPHFGVTGYISRFSIYYRKYKTEFDVINRILSGDFSSDSAFSRHYRSLPARIWFRIRIMFPRARKNLFQYYQTHKLGHDPSIPSLYSSVLRQLRSLLSNR